MIDPAKFEPHVPHPAQDTEARKRYHMDVAHWMGVVNTKPSAECWAAAISDYEL